MDRVSMFTSQPKVSFSRRVAFRSFRWAPALLFSPFFSSRFPGSISAVRSFLLVLFFPLFTNIFLSARKTSWKNVPYWFQLFVYDRRKDFRKCFSFNLKVQITITQILTLLFISSKIVVCMRYIIIIINRRQMKNIVT